MQYLLLIYPDEAPERFEQLSEERQAAISAEYFALAEADGMLGGAQLQPAATATTVRVNGNGEALMTDGPFPTTKEVLGGYYLFEADDIDAALEIAARIPAARMGGAVEVRPLVER
jgi:hypothetical protein